jgi:hypothetical protein
MQWLEPSELVRQQRVATNIGLNPTNSATFGKVPRTCSLENTRNPFTFNVQDAAIFMVRCDAEGGMTYS